MKAVLLVVLLLGLSQVFGQTVNPIVNAVVNNGVANNCQPQYWRLDASALSPQSYMFIYLVDLVATSGYDVQLWYAYGYQPSATQNVGGCNSAVNNQCTIRADCEFLNQVIYFTTIKINDQSNNSVNFNFTVTINPVSITDLTSISNLPVRRIGGVGAALDPTQPYPPNYDHYKFAVTIGPAAQGADLVINITAIVGSTTSLPALVANINIGQYAENDDTTCYKNTCTQGGSVDFCTMTFAYCNVVGGEYYLAVKRVNDGTNYYNYTINGYWVTQTIIPLTPGVPKYGQVWYAGIETYYTFTSQGPNDEVSISVYDVAGGTLHWQASQNYLYRYNAAPGVGSNCAVSAQCLTPYSDSCRDQYHYCPTPSASTSTTWFVNVRADTVSTSVRNRDIISWVIVANVKARATVTLSNPVFAVTGAVPQENYDYYQFVVPAVITNQTFYIELYVDNTEDEALLYRNYLQDGSTFAGPITNGNVKCSEYDWFCTAGSHSNNQRCFMQIPTCKLVPGTTIYFSVYGVKSQYYGVPVAYTLFGGLVSPLLLQDSISYQDSTNNGTYVHYKYHYDQTDFTPGDALMIEVTNIKLSTTTNVYVSFQNMLAGDCPCYTYDYICTNANECFFDTFVLFGGSGCRGLVPQDIYISVLGVQDAGLANIGYTITITRYNWAGPINTLTTDTLTYAYISNQEYNYYVLDTTHLTIANPIMTFHVRFVEYEANNDNEQLTLYVLQDNLLSPTCTPLVCTTSKYNSATPNAPYSYCEVRLNPCQFSTSHTWYVVVYGVGGQDKARPIHYTIIAKSGAVTPTALTNGVPMPGMVTVRQVSHYTYTIANTNNNRLYVEMYMDKDTARNVNFKVNFGYPSSAQPCYNYSATCTLITDYTTKCVYHIPNCQLQVGTYWFGVESLDDFYHQPAPFTITATEKVEILPLADATSANGGPIFMNFQRGEYQVFKFDATQYLPGDIFYLEVDQIEGGSVDIVINADTPRGYCPCYSPQNAMATSAAAGVTTYFLQALPCSGPRIYYMYVSPHLQAAASFSGAATIAFSASVYINHSPAAQVLAPGQAAGINGTVITSHYTHNYYTIAQNPAKAQSTLVIYFATVNSTLPQFAYLYGRSGSSVNDLCGVTPLCDGSAHSNCSAIFLNPCSHRIDQGAYYFDVTATTNDSYAYQFFYYWIDPIALPISTSTNGTINPNSGWNTYYYFTATMISGSILNLAVTGFQGTGSSMVQYATGSLFGSYCNCANTPTNVGTLSSGNDVTTQIPYCTTGMGNVMIYVTVSGGAPGTFLIQWSVTNPTNVRSLGNGNPGTISITDWMTTQGSFKFFTFQLPSNMASLQAEVQLTAGSGTDFELHLTQGTTVALPGALNCNVGTTCPGNACEFDECCVDSSHGAIWSVTLLKLSATATNATFTIQGSLLSRMQNNPLTVNINQTRIVPSIYGSNHQLANILPGSVVNVLFFSTNASSALQVYYNNLQYTPATFGTAFPCWGTGTQICNTFAAGTDCAYQINCPAALYEFGVYNNLANAITYSIVANVYPPTALALGTLLPVSVTTATVGAGLQFYVSVPTTAPFSDVFHTLTFLITEISTGSSTLTAYYNLDGPVTATGLPNGGCGTAGTPLCTNANNASQCLNGVSLPQFTPCPTNRGHVWWIAVVLSATGTYNIRAVVGSTGNRGTLVNGANPAVMQTPPFYYQYPYTLPLQSVDVLFLSQNPTNLNANIRYGDVCATAVALPVDGVTRFRVYPCQLVQTTPNTLFFDVQSGAPAASNWTYTLTPMSYTVTPYSLYQNVTGGTDHDTTYSYYSFVLPAMTEFQTVTVTFSVSCGAVYIVEQYNSIAYPDTFPPTTAGSTCYLNNYHAVAGTPVQISYTYCNWKDRNDRTIYYTIVGDTRPYQPYVITYTITSTLTGGQTVPELPFRQEFLHTAAISPNGLYWFETQTESVGTQIYIKTHGLTTPLSGLSTLVNEWFGDSNCAYTDQSIYNELTTSGTPNFDNPTCTADAQNTGYSYCWYEVYPGIYRDGRYYLQLDTNAMADPNFIMYAWVERQGSWLITQNWAGYASLGLPKEYQFYAIATAGNSYVTITLWNVTYGAVTLLLPEYGTAQSNLIGRSQNLPSFGTTDTTEQWQDGNSAQSYVVPLASCYFCTPYIYVAVRADSYTVAGVNSTLTYNIKFHFGIEMQIPNDTYVCHQTSFAVQNNETDQLNMDWEDIWVVNNWVNNGEQWFQYDFLAGITQLVHTFSPTGTASDPALAVGTGQCAFTSAQSTTTAAGASATPVFKCAYSQYHITVLDSTPQYQSTYYLHPVVYHWPVQAYTLGTTVGSIGQCPASGAKLYYKVATTLTATNKLVVDHSATAMYTYYGGVAFTTNAGSSECVAQSMVDISSGHTEDLCHIQTGTLYFTIVPPAADWTAVVNVVETAPVPIVLNTPYHDFAGPSVYNIYSLPVTSLPGQSLTVSATSVSQGGNAEMLNIWVTKSNVHGFCTTPYKTTSASFTPSVTITSCDTISATYYIFVETAGGGCSVGEFYLTATLSTPVTATALTSGTPLVNSVNNAARNNYYIAPTGGSLLSVRIRNTMRGTSITAKINAGNVVGLSSETCAWTTPAAICGTFGTLPTNPSTWCVTEIAPCAYSAAQIYGISVDGGAASNSYEITATAVTPVALTSTPAAVTINQDAAYFTITQAAPAALSLRVIVSTGKVQVSVNSNNCLASKTCNDYSQDFRCDAYEGECRLEFASAPTHALQLNYFVKVFGTATFTIAAVSGTANNINVLPAAAFCTGIVNYNFWQYKNATKRDQEANRLYTRWITKGKWQCPSVPCQNALKALACYYMFPAGDANGFLLDPCQTSCVFAQQTCIGNFTWAGFPEFDCTNHLYKPGPTCTGAPPGCDGVPGSGKTYDVCGVCGGNGQECSGPATSVNPTGPSTSLTSLTSATTNSSTSAFTTTTGGASTNSSTTATKTTSTTGVTTTKTTSATTGVTTTGAGPTQTTTTTGTTSVNAAGLATPVSVFVALFVVILTFVF